MGSGSGCCELESESTARGRVNGRFGLAQGMVWEAGKGSVLFQKEARAKKSQARSGTATGQDRTGTSSWQLVRKSWKRGRRELWCSGLPGAPIRLTVDVMLSQNPSSSRTRSPQAVAGLLLVPDSFLTKSWPATVCPSHNAPRVR